MLRLACSPRPRAMRRGRRLGYLRGSWSRCNRRAASCLVSSDSLWLCSASSRCFAWIDLGTGIIRRFNARWLCRQADCPLAVRGHHQVVLRPQKVGGSRKTFASLPAAPRWPPSGNHRSLAANVPMALIEHPSDRCPGSPRSRGGGSRRECQGSSSMERKTPWQPVCLVPSVQRHHHVTREVG